MSNDDSAERFALSGLLSIAISEIYRCYVQVDDKKIATDPGFVVEIERLQRIVMKILMLDSALETNLVNISQSNEIEAHLITFIKLLVVEQDSFTAARESANNALREGLEKVNSVLIAAEEENSNMSSSNMSRADHSDNKDEIDETIVSNRNVQASGGVNFNYSYIKKDVENITENNKIAILYALLTASVADFSDSNSQIRKRGYDARLRVSLRLIADWLNVPWQTVVAMEYMLALAALKGASGNGSDADPSADGDQKLSKWSSWKKTAIIGGTAAAAGTVLILTAGLAAPAIVAGLAALGPTLAAVPLLGTSLAGAVAVAGTTAGSVAVIGAFGAAGAGLGGYKMSRRIGGVQEFSFIDLEKLDEVDAVSEELPAGPSTQEPAAAEIPERGDREAASGSGKRWNWASKSKRIPEGGNGTPDEGLQSSGGGREPEMKKQAPELERAAAISQPEKPKKWEMSWRFQGRKGSGKSAVDGSMSAQFKPHLAVSIVVSGFVRSKSDYLKPWGKPQPGSQTFSLLYESEYLIPLSTALEDMLKQTLVEKAMTQGAMLTVLSTLVLAMVWPLALIGALGAIDGKFALAMDRSQKAGKVLADVLLKGLQGGRPVTLMGYSMGCVVIFSCLEELAKQKAYGIVERVVLLGAPLVGTNVSNWKAARSVVAGRFVNGYNSNDWTLGLLYRTSFLASGVAGIQPVDVGGIENVDVTSHSKRGHLSYISNLERILQVIGVDRLSVCIDKNDHV